MSSLEDRFDLVRGNPGFGRKVKWKGKKHTGLAEVMKYRPVDIHYFDDTTEETTIQTVQDIGPIIEDNKRLRNESDGYSPSRDLKHVARIPNVIVTELLLKHGINVMDPNDGPKLMAILDSPEYAYLKTSDGTISKKPYREIPTAKEGWLKR